MSDLMELLRAHASEQGDERETLTDAQMVARLTECVGALSEKHDFQPGDILLHKFPSLAHIKDAARPVIYICDVDPFNAADVVVADDPNVFGSSGITLHYDCICGCIVDGRFIRYFFDSADFRPHPDFPRQPAE